MKKIILITGEPESARLARRSALYAESPSDCRIVRTRRDLRACLASGHTALVDTMPRLLQIRETNLRAEYPEVPLEVISVDA